jgi:prolipoprotein diacylglyceryltransferase
LQEPDKSGQSRQESRPLGPAGWFAIVVLAGFLAVGIFYAVHAWNALAGTPIPAVGWVFLVLGVVFTILVGGGLMALLFYSSRKGKDF